MTREAPDVTARPSSRWSLVRRFVQPIIRRLRANGLQTAAGWESERLGLAMESGAIGAIEIDFLSAQATLSDKWREIWGLALGVAVTADDLDAMVAEDDRLAHRTAQLRALDPRGTGLFQACFRIRRGNDGAVRWVNSRGHVHFENGVAVRMLGVTRDVTDEVTAAAALEEKAQLAEQLTLLASALPGAIYSFVRRPDGSSYLSYAAPHVETLLGFGPETYSHDLRALAERVHPDDFAGLFESLIEAARTKALWRALFRYDHPKKGEIWIEGHSQPAPETEGITVWHGYLQDVTGRVSADRALGESEARVRKLRDERLAALEKLAAGLAHEVNQPLAAGATLLAVARRRMEALRASLGSEALRAEDAAKGQAKGDARGDATGEAGDAAFNKAMAALDRAAEQMVRAGRTISRVREFSRLGEPNKTYRSLHETVHEALAALGGDAGLAIFDIELRLEAARDGVLVDRLQMIELLVNLIQNAQQATSPDDRYTIGIASRNQRDQIEIAVSDSGSGLSDNARAHLFELFWTSKSSGMGMGLALSRGIVEAHSGRLWAQDNPAGGAIFTFSLPLVEKNEGREDER